MNPSKQPGSPQKSTKKPRQKILLIIGVLVFLTLAITGILFPTSSNETNSANSAEAEASSTSSTFDSEASVKTPGEPLVTDQFEITVAGSIKTREINGGGFMRYTPSVGCEYAVIKVILKNVSNNIRTFKGEDFLLVSPGGSAEYAPVQLVVANTEERYLWTESLNPSFAITGNLVFEIPDGTDLSTLQLKYRDTWSHAGIYYHYFLL